MLRPESEALQRPFGARSTPVRRTARRTVRYSVRRMFQYCGSTALRGAVRSGARFSTRSNGWLGGHGADGCGPFRSPAEVSCVRPRYYASARGTMRPDGAVPESCRHIPGRSSAGRTGGPQGASAPKPKKNGFRPACFDFFPYFCRRFRIAAGRHPGVATGPGPFP